MFSSLKIFVMVFCALSVNAQRRYGSNCRNVNCASSQQCLGLYEQCKGDLVDGSTCGFYATCVDLNGEVKHSERPASVSNVAEDPKPTQRNFTDVASTDNTNDIGKLYPGLPQPDTPSAPQGGFYPQNPQGGYSPPNQQGGFSPPNPQGGYSPPNPQGGYSPQNPQGGYYPQNPQGGYYPQNPQGYPNSPAGTPQSGNKKDSESSSGFGSTLLNLFTGGNRGSSGSSGNSGGPDLGSLLSILGSSNTNTNMGSNSGSGGFDFSSLLGAFTGNGQNTRNNYDNRNPTGQVGPNPSFGGQNQAQGNGQSSYGANNGQNPNQAQDSGPSLLQTLGNFATSPLGQQLLVNALRSRDNGNDAQQSRRYGGVFSENNSRTPQNVSGAGAKGYPTQPPYPPQND